MVFRLRDSNYSGNLWIGERNRELGGRRREDRRPKTGRLEDIYVGFMILEVKPKWERVSAPDKIQTIVFILFKSNIF